MSFLKTEFARFFMLGFAGGAVLVLGTLGIGSAVDIANGIVPAAQAAQAN